MKKKSMAVTAIVLCAAVLMIGIAVGSASLSPVDILRIIWAKTTGGKLPEGIGTVTAAILWNLRLPRALLAFLVGAGLSASGTVMQSVLKNPLASSYTLGVSSGAALGAGLVIITGFSVPLLGNFSLPLIGLAGGLGSVLFAVTFTMKVDRTMGNNTIILVGMVFSMFTNAVLTMLSALSREHTQRILYWQMGSFSLKDWSSVLILTPVTLLGIFFLMRHTAELDIMTFGEEQAQAIGVELRRTKWLLLGVSSALTGCAVAFTGVVGFIDLIAPHVVRKLFGSSHKYVLPFSALFGGAFMVLADLFSRTVISPSELPVGAVTAILGAPFFAYVYFSGRRKG